MIAKFSRIVLWISFIVTICLGSLYFLGETEEVALSTQGTTECPVYIDPFMYWIYAVVLIGVVALILFAIAQLFSMFKSSPKEALKTIGVFVVFFAIMGICWAMGDNSDYSKIVNGSTISYSGEEMQMVDMWIYSIYAMVGITVVLVLGFGVKKLITK